MVLLKHTNVFFLRFILPSFFIIKNGVRTIAPEENCPPVNCPTGNYHRGQLPPEQFPPGQLRPRKTAPSDNCPRGKLSPGKLPSHQNIFLKNNCPHSSKFPSTSATSELRKTMHCLSTSTIIYEYCNLGLKIDFLPYMFYRF